MTGNFADALIRMMAGRQFDRQPRPPEPVTPPDAAAVNPDEQPPCDDTAETPLVTRTPRPDR